MVHLPSYVPRRLNEFNELDATKAPIIYSILTSSRKTLWSCLATSSPAAVLLRRPVHVPKNIGFRAKALDLHPT